MPTVDLSDQDDDEDWLNKLLNGQLAAPTSGPPAPSGLSLNGQQPQPQPAPLTSADIIAGRSPWGKQEAQPYSDPTWAGQLGHKFEQAASGLGAGPSATAAAGDIGTAIGGAAGSMSLHDFEPNVIEAYNRIKAGQYGQALGPALAALPITPGASLGEGVAKTVGEDVSRSVAGPLAEGGITAYHASPYDFDRFDISKIGTGQGAQSFGHGLYFAENPAVADEYRQEFSAAATDPMSPDALAQSMLDRPAIGGDREKAIAELQSRQDEYANKYDRARMDPHWRNVVEDTDMNAAINLLKDPSWDPLRHGAYSYEVNINANPEQFLDWDKPLSQQPQAVQDFVANHPQAQRLQGNDATGETIIRRLGDGPEAAQALAEAGVPGVKFLDQGSRNVGAGSHNYVTFSDDIINILRKYGLTGLGLTAGIGALATQRPSTAEAAPRY
jgi:hypothetical protein